MTLLTAEKAMHLAFKVERQATELAPVVTRLSVDGVPRKDSLGCFARNLTSDNRAKHSSHASDHVVSELEPIPVKANQLPTEPGYELVDLRGNRTQFSTKQQEVQL